MDKRVQSDNPYREPDHSTVEDWHGQEVARDSDRAEELLEESGGDQDEAEARFERERPERSRGKPSA